MKIVFIAGPYFGNGDREKIEQNIRNAEKYQIALANEGIGFFCSHNHTEHFEEKAKASEDFYKEMDMMILQKTADAILAIPGWENSAGAKNEVAWAKKNNLPIFYPESPDDLEEIIKWRSHV
jgi:hypothetical protein